MSQAKGMLALNWMAPFPFCSVQDPTHGAGHIQGGSVNSFPKDTPEGMPH